MPDVFDKINIELPRERILRRLGYKRGITGLTSAENKKLEAGMEEGLALIRLKGAAKRVPIRDKSDACIELADGIALAGRKLAALLRGSEEVLLMGATAGPEIMAAIGRFSNAGDLAKAVVFDAVASEVVDSALDWIARYYNNVLRREGRQLTSRRYSAGYADFALENQAIFFRELELARLGVQLTSSFILVPEKSVTAIAGIEKTGSRNNE